MGEGDHTPTARRAKMASREVGFETELRAFLQRRLALVTTYLGLTGAVLFVVGRLTDVVNHGWVLANWLHPSVLTHLAVVLLAIPLRRFLRGRTLKARGLLVVDSGIAELVIGSCLLIYFFSYVTGMRQLVPILAFLLVARAIVIPSRARRTFFLSVPALIGILAIQLAHGKVYTLDGAVWPQAGFTAYVVWDLAVMLVALGLACLTSWVLYELRVRAHEAAQLGRYTLEKRIGGGAIGEVYRARHAHIRRPVAVKILRPELAGEKSVERFEKEVQRTSELTHPNTVNIFDYGFTADGLFYYAMEYLEGADLERVVTVGGPMPPARVLYVLAQACEALEEAHGQGLIHCDIKPANLMLCARGGKPDVVKVLDFGLARNVVKRDGEDDHGDAFGTPLTMAPEVILQRELTARTDLYSLGAVGYYLATGTPPFGGETLGEILQQHLRATPEPPSARADVPPDLEACLLHCLEKDPLARPDGAAALGEALARCRDAGQWSSTDAEAWWDAHATELTADVEAERSEPAESGQFDMGRTL